MEKQLHIGCLNLRSHIIFSIFATRHNFFYFSKKTDQTYKAMSWADDIYFRHVFLFAKRLIFCKTWFQVYQIRIKIGKMLGK